MSMEMMKKLALASLGAAALATTGSVQAQTNNAGQWDTLQVFNLTTSAYDTVPLNTTVSDIEFYGATSLSAFIGADCHLSLVGDVTRTSDRVEIEVTGGEIVRESGDDSICDSLSLGGFPWVAYDRGADPSTDAPGVTDANSPYPATEDVLGLVDGVEVYYTIFGSPTQICGGQIDVVFNNGSPITEKSYFDFDANIIGSGSCSVDGRLLNADGNNDTTGDDDTNVY